MNKNTKSKKAFTLIEVMLAVGVIAVTLTAMIGLLAAITGNVNQIRYQTKAVALIANLETMLKTKSFDSVYKWVASAASPHVIYFWDEYQNPDDVDNSSLVTLNSEMPGMVSGVAPTEEHLKNSEGEIFRIFLSLYQSGLKGQKTTINDESEYSGGPLNGESSTYALSYLPMKVEILVDPRDDVVNGTGDENVNEQRRVYEDIIVKMR